MKKFSVFAVLLLILAMTTVFVACNQNDAKPIKLKEGMTLDSVKTEFKNLESMTYEAYDKDGNVGFAMTSTKNGYYRASFANGYSYAAFIEDDRFYEFRTEGNKLDYDIISTAGFDVDTSSFSMIEPMLEDLFEEMEEKGFRIENNNIIIEYGAQDNSDWSKIVAKDFNTALITVPVNFKKSYKSLATTKSMLVFEDIDGTTCKLTDTALTLNSLTVPERNGEKTVVEADLGGISTVVIPKTVKKVEGLFDDTDITFLGTKAEWFAVNLGVTQEKSLYNVHCSDGDIKVGDDVVKSNPDTPDTPDTPDQPDKPDTPDKPTDDPNYPGTKLTPGMTLAEVKDFLKKAQSMTVKSYSLDGIGWVEICKVTQNGWSGYYDGYSEYNFAEFIENGRYYELKESSRTIVNIGNYDVPRPTSYIANIRNLLIEELDENGVFAIEDGKLIIDFKTGQRSVASDFGSTELYIPEKYTNYKTLSANKTVLSYTDGNTSAYGISAVNIKLNSLTVPSMNNGRTVASVNFSNNVTNVTIPNTVTSFSGLAEGANVTYQGTKEEWAEIKFAYTNDQEPFNVRCTDGTIQAGSKKLKPKPKAENVQAFFNTLWEKSTSIGNTEIAQNDDLKIDLGFTVKFATQDDEGIEYQVIDIGVDYKFVLDRSSAKGSSEHTALKARLYDPSNNETWVTLYYFFNDVENVYADFAGQNFKIPFEYFNDTFNKGFDNFINSDKFSQNKTIGEMIAAVTENMGANWNLNVLVDDIVKFFGINLKDMIAGNDMIGGVIEGLLGDGASIDDVFDGDVLNIRKILTNDNIAQALFIDDDTIVNRNGFYSTAIDLNGDIGSMVVGMIPEGIDSIINADTELSLQYQLNNGALDSFGIKAVLTDIESTVGETTVYPAITINITDLKCSKARTGDIENSMPVAKSNYSADAVLDTNVVLDLAGFSLDATRLDSLNDNRFSQVAGLDNLQLKGKISVGFTRKIDFKDNNGTAAYAHISYKLDNSTAAVKVCELSLVNGNLAVKINQSANLVALDSTGKTVNVPIARTFINLWGDIFYNALRDKVFTGNPEVLADLEGKLFSNKDHRTINPNFKGAVWTGIDIVNEFKSVMDGLFAEKPANESADMATIIRNIVKTVERALPLISTEDNKLAVATDNIGNTVNSIGKVWWGNKAPDFKDSIIAADKDNWLDKFTEAIKIEGATYTTKQDFLRTIFNSSANVALDMSKNGLSLDLNVNVMAKASIKLAFSVGAKANATITDLSAGWTEDANTFVFNISSAPTKGTVNADGTLTLTGIEGSIIDVRIGDGEYFRVEGTWNGNTFTSKTALPDVLEKTLIRARMTAPGTDGPSSGVKMTNNYVAPKTDAQ